jgi:hypothetical protein
MEEINKVIEKIMNGEIIDNKEVDTLIKALEQSKDDQQKKLLFRGVTE